MSDNELPPIKGARRGQETRDNDVSDMTATREISASALESDRPLNKPAGSRKSGDIESGNAKRRGKKLSPEE